VYQSTSKMRVFDYVLMTCLGFVIVEAFVIVTINIKRGFWKPVNWTHVLSAFFYIIYLASVVYSTQMRNRSHRWCDALWKVTSTLYIALTMAVYSFYYARSKIWEIIKWNGKEGLERLAVVSIAAMGLLGLSFFWLPIRGVQYNALLIDGECAPVRRQWIAIVWMLGDTALSAVLLVLFIRPLKEIRRLLGNTPKSIAMLLQLRQLIQKNRNLLGVTVFVTLAVFVTIVVSDRTLQFVHYLCVIDRLITLQCITLTFSYDSQDYFYCNACLLLSCDNPKQSEVDLSVSSWTSPTIIHISPKLQSASRTSKSSSIRINLGSVV